MKINYDDVIPEGVLFSLKELENMKILKVSMAKKMIANGEIEVVKIGNKLHIARAVIVAFLAENTLCTHN